METIGAFGHDVINYIIALLEYFALRARIYAANTANWISPFKVLSALLSEVDTFLWDLSEEVIKFRGEYDKIVDRLNAILDTWGLDILIETLFSEWRSFRLDPRTYISDKIAEMFDTWSSLRTDADRWVMSRIQSAELFGWEWLRDPVGKMREWLQVEYPIFYTLLSDPTQGVKDALSRISPEVAQLISDPVGYIKDRFIDSLGWSGEFWANPWGYLFSEILEAIEQHIGEWRHELTRKGERIIRYIWEGRM